ncbi:MBL fold metallo-hydrolase [Porphyromonadaceae sp. NP-X]|jgi:7,8-dihydropterin-6-yl-methyl-4-(beta-D-ribofuranosyl)aminobenzene 5'-phosphate synthase|nr:MBL fold metallo-hydrolase [Porphyromonadaceae sp. NP-X]
MKAVVLSDNRKGFSDIEIEHGLSIYLETEKHRILLDTGGSDLFLQNAAKLNIDLKAVDYVFISHGHNDHMGGLPHFLKINTRANIIVSPNVMHRSFYSKRNGFHTIGLDLDFSPYQRRLIPIEKEYRLDDEISIFTNISARFKQPLANQTLFCEDKNHEIIPDDFSHELIFTLTNNERLFVFTGCAHKGLLNILETVKEKLESPIQWVMGGFHLLDSKNGVNYETEENIAEIAHYLNAHYPSSMFITGHCTGDQVFNQLKNRLKDRLIQFYSGYTIQF